MPKLYSIGLGVPEYNVSQTDVMKFAKQLFSQSFRDIERLINVFRNGEIESRYFVKNMEWFSEVHSFAEKNDVFIEEAVKLGIQAIKKCLHGEHVKQQNINDIDAIFTICTTGLSTPSLEARIMNKLEFRMDVKRIPIWGLGCAGGAAGLSRAYEYCLAFPKAKVLVLSIELCSLTFQKDDHSKSNLIGTSLFADGAACALIVGDEVKMETNQDRKTYPRIVGTQSMLMKDSLDVMGWDIRDDGLHVVFSKDIPIIVKRWLQPHVLSFLKKYHLTMNDITQFVAHPGGKKIMDAYVKALGIDEELLLDAKNILRNYGNMSSVTIFYVLKRILEKEVQSGEWGIAIALGPGFSSEQLLIRWD